MHGCATLRSNQAHPATNSRNKPARELRAPLSATNWPLGYDFGGPTILEPTTHTGFVVRVHLAKFALEIDFFTSHYAIAKDKIERD